MKMYLLFLYLLCPAHTDENLCSKSRCCLGYTFDESGHCVACPKGTTGINCTDTCPEGYFGRLCRQRCECSSDEFCNATSGCIKSACPTGTVGVNCTGTCPAGSFGHLCRQRCECSEEICNATFGCIKYGVDYFNPTTLSIVIPTTLGLLCIFILSCTIIVLKMRQRAQNEVPQANVRSCENEYGISSVGQGCRTYNEIDTSDDSDDFPPPPYMSDYNDLCGSRVDSKLYDTLSD